MILIIDYNYLDGSTEQLLDRYKQMRSSVKLIILSLNDDF